MCRSEFSKQLQTCTSSRDVTPRHQQPVTQCACLGVTCAGSKLAVHRNLSLQRIPCYPKIYLDYHEMRLVIAGLFTPGTLLMWNPGRYLEGGQSHLRYTILVPACPWGPVPFEQCYHKMARYQLENRFPCPLLALKPHCFVLPHLQPCIGNSTAFPRMPLPSHADSCVGVMRRSTLHVQ